MAWSYSDNPASSAKDAVRFLIGDTDNTDPLLSDGEINYFLAQYNSIPLNAAVRCCETIMAKFSRMADERVGGVSINFSQKAKMYRDLRNELIQRIAMEDASPYCGGISRSDVLQNNQNSDRVLPDFTKHMMENQLIAPWVTTEWGLWGDQPVVE